MNIAVLSGKGGTGKTFVSVNLASVIAESVYIDCDVEEPNGHLFFNPHSIVSKDVCVSIPRVNLEKCIGCRSCVDFCRFNAIAFIKNKPVKFKDVCHGCGGCKLVCKQGAIYEESYPVGKIKIGKHRNTTVVTGIMNTGEESGVPIIRALKKELGGRINIIDCPPGSACTVMESIEMADFCLIVAEPTVFGVHNFLMVYELVSILKKPFGVIINKDDNEENPMVKLCRERQLPVIMRIGYSADIASMNADGKIASENNNDINALFQKLASEVCM